MNAWPTLDADGVRALAPAAVAAFDDVIAAVAGAYEPARLELARRRTATLLQLPVEGLPQLAALPDPVLAALPQWPSAAAFDATDRAILGFTEQFVIDVGSVSVADRTALTDAVGAAAFGVIRALYVLDHAARLVAVTEQLFGVSPFWFATADEPAPLWPALETMMSAVITLQQVPPLTAELVRLRGARFHHCRLCESRRLVDAVEVDADALEDADALGRDGLSAADRAALLLTDAILLSPAAVPPATLAAVRESITPDQTLELALLIAHNAANKIAVALGADAPTVTDGLEYFSVDVSGSYRYGLPKP